MKRQFCVEACKSNYGTDLGSWEIMETGFSKQMEAVHRMRELSASNPGLAMRVRRLSKNGR